MNKLLLSLLCLFVGGVAGAETIAIIGTGKVGSALGAAFHEQGHTIVYGSRNPNRHSVEELVADTGDNASATIPQEAVIGADIVVLAVPGLAVGEVVESLGDLSGKIIIDPTNPMERKLLKFYHASDSSNTELVQSLAPDADVVKAFNTLSTEFMTDPSRAGGPVSVPLAGDSGGAKDVVAELVVGMGLEPIDVGGAERAKWVEGMGILLVNNMFSTRKSFNYHLREVP
ncbi:MAG: NADPH-dependent F420 reductase [Woeseiaceae bacterium]|nr:NADPH-dependent F420 reductase [Woeseiaceae bacterium]